MSCPQAELFECPLHGLRRSNPGTGLGKLRCDFTQVINHIAASLDLPVYQVCASRIIQSRKVLIAEPGSGASEYTR
jgi:hypothetical protein